MKHSLKATVYLIVGATLLLSGTAIAQTAKDLFLDKCAVCHGADGHAKTAMGKKSKATDVTVSVQKFTDGEMRKIVEEGKKPYMNAWGKEFSKEQIAGLVEYFRSLGK
jgi:mono/diheme cytochrome c family protein